MNFALGKWKFYIDTMFYRGDAFLTVKELNGEFDISTEIPGMAVPKITYSNIEWDGNTVTGNAKADFLQGKDVPFSVTFEGDTANGFLKAPFIGKIKLKNGEKVG